MAANESIEDMDDSPLAMPADAEALRESFGDRKPPDITRKITACVACRKQKVDCTIEDSQSSLADPRRSNVTCVTLGHHARGAESEASRAPSIVACRCCLKKTQSR